LYWREYRTLFHIGVEYGLHKSTAGVCQDGWPVNL